MCQMGGAVRLDVDRLRVVVFPGCVLTATTSCCLRRVLRSRAVPKLRDLLHLGLVQTRPHATAVSQRSSHL